MAATIPRSSRSLLDPYAAASSLPLLALSASNVCHCTRLACLKRVSDSACGSSTSSLRTRCLQDQSNSKRQSRTLPAQSNLYRSPHQSGHGFAALPNGARWSSTSILPPPGARDGPDEAKRRTFSKYRPLQRTTFSLNEQAGISPTQRHWEQRENMSKDQSWPHAQPSYRHSSPQGMSESQFDPRLKASWSQRDPRGKPSLQQSGPNRRPVSPGPRPMQSGRASLSIPGRANDRGLAQSSRNKTSLTESGSTPPPPPYDVLFCGTDFFALEIVRALYARRGQ